MFAKSWNLHVWSPVIQGLLQHVQNKVCSHGIALSPTNNPAGVDICYGSRPLGRFLLQISEEGEIQRSVIAAFQDQCSLRAE